MFVLLGVLAVYHARGHLDWHSIWTLRLRVDGWCGETLDQYQRRLAEETLLYI